MPNRILKESICTSETIDLLTPEEECLFYRIIVNCDDFGRLDARENVLLAKCFPLKITSIKPATIGKMLKKLQDVGLLYVYSDGKYLQLATWEDHQRIRAQRSKYPEPDADEVIRCQMTADCGQVAADDVKCRRNPIQSESNPNPNPNPKAKAKALSFDGYTTNDALVSALNDFIEMRRSIKAPLTQKAVDLLLKELDKLADNDQTKIDILNQSILKNWKGVFALKAPLTVVGGGNKQTISDDERAKLRRFYGLEAN